MKFLVALALVCVSFVAADWPLTSDPVCNNETDQSTTIEAPIIVDLAILKPVAGASSPFIDTVDRISVTFKFHTSHTIVKIWGRDPPLVNDPYFDNVVAGTGFPYVGLDTDEKARITYHAPEGCYANVTIEIWLGALSAWGFQGQMHSNIHKFIVSGQFWIQAQRPVYAGEELGNVPQVGKVGFSVSIEVETTYSLDIEALTVYGTAKWSGSIIYFREHDWPEKTVTIYYLISVQYPYKFVMITDELTGKIIYPATSVENHPYALSMSFPKAAQLYTYSQNEDYCKKIANDSSANWCYQVVAIDYNIDDACTIEANDKRFDGSYKLDLALGCRENLSPSWNCQVPEESWKYPKMTFTVTSNNICEKFLNYDKTSISGHIDAYDSDKTLGTNEGQYWDDVIQTQYTPDRYIWFVIDLQKGPSFDFKMTKIKVLNITFYKSTEAVTTIWENQDWTDQAKTDLAPTMFCNDGVATPPATNDKCFLADTLPTAWWSLKLNSTSYLWLQGRYAMKLLSVAYIEISYDWATPAKIVPVMFTDRAGSSSIAPSSVTYINADLDSTFTPTTTIVAGSSVTGMVIGIAVGCAAFVGAVVALIVFKLRSKRAGATKLEETTA